MSEDASYLRLLGELRGCAPERVLAAVASIDRRHFVAEELRGRAWEDRPLPIGHDQTISQPSLVIRMVGLIEPPADGRVLDIGTGSGYHAALLSRLCARVLSVERHAQLSEAAAANLAVAGIENVELLIGDGSAGVPDQAPFDAINVAAATTGERLGPLIAQLADGGRLVAPVDGTLVVVERDGARLRRTEHGSVRFVSLVSGD
jgi:protein-L-isoaspartate(D-aspartate) O-methyltransferase